MRILYFTRNQSPHDLRFLKSLSKSEHTVAVVCLENSSQYQWPEGIQVLDWPFAKAKNCYQYASAFKQVASEFRADVVHAGPIQRVAFIAALAGVKPLMSMSWGSDILFEVKKHPFWPWITRFTLRKTDLLAADCQTVVKQAQKYGYTGSVAVFPWGVDLAHFKPGAQGQLRQKLGWEKNIVFLCNRTMAPLYGVDVVAWAFAKTCQKNDQIRLLIFGKGQQEPEIREILRDAEKAGKVYFGGYANLPELPDVYRSADVYISASHSDGSSVSLMEALACGKPALVSDIASNQEWIESGKQGWLFQDGNIASLTQKILEITSINDLSKMSINARLLAEERADWIKNFGILLDAYQQLVEKK
ncbi:MAG: glycosyltransferase family 4 protein [Anaerolineaceae bacterium]